MMISIKFNCSPNVEITPIQNTILMLTLRVFDCAQTDTPQDWKLFLIKVQSSTAAPTIWRNFHPV